MDTRQILLVEDNPDDVVLTMRALTKHGLANDVIVVRDGIEALEYLRAEGPYVGRDARHLPGLVLLDLKLPRMNGLEFLKTIRSDPWLCDLRVVVLTTSSEEEDVVSSYARGASSYVRKPVDFQEFMQAVGQLGIYWLKLNESKTRSGE
ncbi:response regulator [bacterium]|nr:response regulator [bacterium]